jgi:hypothetical protein
VNEHLLRLKQLLDPLLAADATHLQMLQTADACYHFLLDLSGIDTNTSTFREHIHTDQGRSVSTFAAAMCLKDYFRSRAFMLGLIESVHHQRVHHKGQPVRVLYAGTGPFATLVLPLCYLFRPEEVQITGVEINKESLDALQKLIHLFQIEPWFESLIHADLLEFQAPPSSFDIILTETMREALRAESQVAITYHLFPLLKPLGQLLPEEITVDAVVFSHRKEAEMQKLDPKQSNLHLLQIRLDCIFRISRQNCFPLPIPQTDPLEFPPVPVQIPEAIPEHFNSLQLHTNVRVNKNHVLGYRMSGISMPVIVSHLSQHPARSFTFQYKSGKNPGFEMQIIE